jgi:uncharacterized membrane protein (DUF4010 family)
LKLQALHLGLYFESVLSLSILLSTIFGDSGIWTNFIIHSLSLS